MRKAIKAIKRETRENDTTGEARKDENRQERERIERTERIEGMEDPFCNSYERVRETSGPKMSERMFARNEDERAPRNAKGLMLCLLFLSLLFHFVLLLFLSFLFLLLLRHFFLQDSLFLSFAPSAARE